MLTSLHTVHFKCYIVRLDAFISAISTYLAAFIFQSLNEKQRPLSPVCHGLKCPPGYSSYCLPAQTKSTRCIPCVQGTFSTHASRRKTCRPCSRCGENQFESSPCTRTSNVVCQECSRCPPGIEVVQACGKTMDTVCRLKYRSPPSTTNQ